MKQLYQRLPLMLLVLCPFLLQAQLSSITEITLTFTPSSGSAITAKASDADGNGLVVDGPINLSESTDYTLDIELRNIDQNTNITDEVAANPERYQFFFETPGGIIAGDIAYDDTDANSLPVGLANSFTSECVEAEGASGSLRILLSDLMSGKTANSTITDGAAQFDVTWTVNIADAPDAPPCENEEEIITDVILTWTPVGGGDPIVATAKDPDGEGVLDLAVEGPINLLESTEYTLTLTLRNEIEGEDITAEIMEEDDEHMFFFAFTDEVFASPAGDGNVDSRMDPVNYNDQDENGLPVGLSTGWTTECGEENGTGTFRLILKHQPDIKSATSTVDDGGTDLDLTWTVNVAEDPDAPSCENEEEIITDVILTWTPVGGGDPIVATAKDPDGEGVLDLAVEGPVNLLESTEYMLSIQLRNEVEGEDITAEIMEEDDEHMFFFAFTDEVFLSPAGDGNVDNREDPVNYNDQDENGLPVGLSTGWTTECGEESASGTFRLILKHQPGIKSATSTVDDGGTDLDLTWTVNVAEDPDAPPCENEEEIITDVTLTWTPVGGGDPIVATAKDPDGEGVLPLAVEAPINLQENTEYTLSLDLRNEIEGESITEEILQEDDEHMFFFGFTEGIFSSPEGDGNIDNRADAVNYNDQDENGLPVGLSTGWTTAATMSGGTFRLILKHQPDIKSETSTVDDGGTDLDLSWVINTDVTDVDDPIEVDKEALVLGPNPVQQELNWKLENASSNDPVDILIFNSSGQLVKRYRSPAPTINVSTLNPGVYIFQLQQEGQVLTKRFVKTQ